MEHTPGAAIVIVIAATVLFPRRSRLGSQSATTTKDNSRVGLQLKVPRRLPGRSQQARRTSGAVFFFLRSLICPRRSSILRLLHVDEGDGVQEAVPWKTQNDGLIGNDDEDNDEDKDDDKDTRTSSISSSIRQNNNNNNNHNNNNISRKHPTKAPARVSTCSQRA